MLDKELLKKSVKDAFTLTIDDIEWKEYRPNNLLGNPVEGYYAFYRNPEGKIVRKYTIVFQYDESNIGMTARKHIDRFLLFEKVYRDDDSISEYPAPAESGATYNVLQQMSDINDFGSFIRAYTTLDAAKARTLMSIKAVFGYAASHMLKNEDKEMLSKEILETEQTKIPPKHFMRQNKFSNDEYKVLNMAQDIAIFMGVPRENMSIYIYSDDAVCISKNDDEIEVYSGVRGTQKDVATFKNPQDAGLEFLKRVASNEDEERLFEEIYKKKLSLI